MQLTSDSRGDTLIEVMVAFTVFAMVAVGAVTIMNKGTASAQNTLETTLVREQVDNQAEVLRYLHQAYLAKPDDAGSGPSSKFKSIVTLAKDANLSQPTRYGDSCTQTIPGDASKRFVLDPLTGSMVSHIKPADDASSPAFAQVAASPSGPTAYGLWVEPVVSNEGVDAGAEQFIDFHIRACWNNASSGPQRTIGTIVRLYVPENVYRG